MKKKRRKIAIVENCAECPYSRKDIYFSSVYYCLLEDPDGRRSIINPHSEIPTWCPLEDAK